MDGKPVGVQDLGAVHFRAVRSVETGSWLGRAHQGQGLGREMREAILHLAFAGLGAEEALSGAFEDNVASLATSRAVGYEENGEARGHRRDGSGRTIRFRLGRAAWERRRRDDIEIIGLEGCLDMFVGPRRLKAPGTPRPASGRAPGRFVRRSSDAAATSSAASPPALLFAW